MINILSYLGMSLQAEVCLWTLLGLVRTIFDATLFKVNANLKQVWQMSMPRELSLSVQRGLRTMISGVMLVQCFTVYVYLASYIVLLYPVFLEERPVLVLPWLLLAAIRKLLCELTSLALGLGACVLLGPARPPCIKFVVIKVISIMPTFYMWMLLYSYYNTLKVASVFKTFSKGLPPSELDYGLELAVRRRRAKSLLGEDQLRKRLISNCYTNNSLINADMVRTKTDYSTRMTHGTDTSTEDDTEDLSIRPPVSINSARLISDAPLWCDDWLAHEVTIPRDTDRILEQFGVMMLRIGAYINKEGINLSDSQLLSQSEFENLKYNSLNCTSMPPDHADTPPLVGSSNARTASYLKDYPQIFMKKPEISLSLVQPENSIVFPSQSGITNKTDEDIKINGKCLSHSVSNMFKNIDPVQMKVTTSIDSKYLRNELKDKSVAFFPNQMNTSSVSDVSNIKDDEDPDALSSKDSLHYIIEDMNRRQSLNTNSLKVDITRCKTKCSSNIGHSVNNLVLKDLSTTILQETSLYLTDDNTSPTLPQKRRLKKMKLICKTNLK